MEIAGDKVLDLALGSMIAGPEPFVGVQQQCRDEICVEPPGDIARIGDSDVVLPNSDPMILPMIVLPTPCRPRKASAVPHFSPGC